MIWLEWGGVALGMLALIWAILALCGAFLWRRKTAGLQRQLQATRVPATRVQYDPAMLSGLPAPVQRYFRAALTPGQPLVASATLAHEGSFNLGTVADNWKPFSSRQSVEIAPPGFVWDGLIRMAPGLPVHVHDAYVAGEGVLVPAVFGLIKLTELRGSGDIAQGELMRWLAEAAWYPTALLPGGGIAWTEIDDQTALATLRDGEVVAELTFRFGADGLISSVRSETRARMVGNQSVPTPWEGRWSEYQRRDGMMVPMSGEVAWILPEGAKPYWRGRVKALAYRFAA